MSNAFKTRYVAGFAFHNGHVYLIEKKRPVWQKGLWNGIGGHIEQGETPEEAMIREFQEETGVRVEGWEKFCILSGAGFEVIFFRNFLTEPIDVQQTTDEVVLSWHLHELPSTIPNLNWLIPMAIHEKEGRGMPYFIKENTDEE